MSWGGSEFSTETYYDSYFATPGIVFFASSGDNGAGVIWPSSSPNVVGVGGTTLNLDSSGAVTSETAWSGSGGGVSAYEAKPTYQTNYGVTTARRAVPDVSYDADPNTGVLVYDSTPYQGSSGWWVVGGTSAGAPQWAAIQALGLSANNNNFYQDAASSAYASYFRDITSGSNGYAAGPGYDLVTGLGSPVTTSFTASVTPDFSLSASPAYLTIRSGSSGTSTITITALNGFTGTVMLSASAPTGLAASLNPVSISTSGKSTLTITVQSNIRAGIYTVTVTGTSGTLSHTASVRVTVLRRH
jgi:subtilase family serine protease